MNKEEERDKVNPLLGTKYVCIIEVYLLKYYFESHLIYNDANSIIDKQSPIIKYYVDIIGLCHGVVIF